MSLVFLSEFQQKQCQEFLEKGYTVFDLEKMDNLYQIKKMMVEFVQEKYKGLIPDAEKDFFNQAHKYLAPEELNDFRVNMISFLTGSMEVKRLVYEMGKETLGNLVGNELAMQRGINLSIQFPKDDESLLPLHSDVWSGNSPYEVVFWLPLVDCFKTKSMFVLDRTKSQKVFSEFSRYSDLTAEELFQEIKPDLEWLTVPEGKGIIFSHSILHGNRINEEDTTRWTFNIRFKSLLSPYAQKELGETFIPLNVKPVTRVGYEYIKPNVN